MNTHNPKSFQFRYARPAEGVAYRPSLDRMSVRTLSSESLFQRGEHEIGIAHGEFALQAEDHPAGKAHPE